MSSSALKLCLETSRDIKWGSQINVKFGPDGDGMRKCQTSVSVESTVSHTYSKNKHDATTQWCRQNIAADKLKMADR